MSNVWLLGESGKPCLWLLCFLFCGVNFPITINSGYQGDVTKCEVKKRHAQSSPASIWASSGTPLTLSLMNKKRRTWKVNNSLKLTDSKWQSENSHSGRDLEAWVFKYYAVYPKRWIIMLKGWCEPRAHTNSTFFNRRKLSPKSFYWLIHG